MAKLTINDIQNPKRKSGFEHVNSANSGPNSRPTKHDRWRASCGWNGSNAIWRGPVRHTPDEAAKDYCDYINGNPLTSKPKRPKAPKRSSLYLRSAGHARAKPVKAKTKNRKPPTRTTRNKIGTVYLIGEEGNTDYVKIGWSRSAGFTRLAGLQTGNPRVLVGIAERPGKLKDEYSLHVQFEPDNVLQEWFEVSPELLSEFDLTPTEFERLVKV